MHFISAPLANFLPSRTLGFGPVYLSPMICLLSQTAIGHVSFKEIRVFLGINGHLLANPGGPGPANYSAR
jgi:hypothetical protein